ncbi:hypothetical protein PV327_010973 [Microctonus hyperodae]|uniref:3-oxo-5-alpha-steroid 4-dehydrogenase C-terminal domain-containing protein n=1 Tax=Microctonus hyperodae TaxID=165561 RepID=A0AA39C7W8_MICHY|nr:hypothetical protein PV327_010973 [Microctonus hyperodae]
MPRRSPVTGIQLSSDAVRVIGDRTRLMENSLWRQIQQYVSLESLEDGTFHMLRNFFVGIVPYRRLFEYISAPLQFTEIMMYLMLTIVLREGSSFYYIFIWVLANQSARRRKKENQQYAQLQGSR